MEKIRILHCLETLGSGGVEQRRLLLAQRLDPEKYEQHIVFSKALRGFDERLEASGTKVYPLGSLGKITNAAYYKRLYRVVKKIKPHIIHGAVFEGVISAAVMGTVCRVPIIITEETSDPQNRSWRGNLLMKIFCSLSDFTVAISPTVSRYLKEKVNVPDAKLRLINNGIADPRVPSDHEVLALKKQLGISSSFVVGSVGRLIDFVKRFSDLIKAVQIIKKSVPEIKLLIVGTGPDQEKLKKLAVDLDVGQNVIFAGYQADMAPYYACMNVFSLASNSEGFGLALVEAMNYKLPVVVTSVGGMKDIVEDGQNGFLVERHNPGALADKILTLCGDSNLRMKFGEAGFEKARREYSSDAYVTNVEKLYAEALHKKKLR